VEDKGKDLKGAVLLEDPTAMPRAYGAYGVKCARDTEDALEKLATLDLHSYILLDQNCSVRPAKQGIKPPTVHIKSYEQANVVLHVAFASSGHVVLADSFYPGWTVQVNGASAEILKANVLGRGVSVPAGEHIIEFAYKPWSVRIGLIIAGCSLFVILLLAFRALPYKPLNITRYFFKLKSSR
jgi:hypothetical protein